MKKHILLISLFIITIFAQNSVTDNISVLLNQKDKDESWIDSMLALTEDFRNSDADLMLPFVKKIIEESKNLDYEDGFVKSSILYSDYLESLRNHALSKSNLFDLLENSDEKHKANIFASLAWNYFDTKDLDSALHFIQEAENSLVDKNSLVAAKVNTTKGMIKGDLGSYDEAISAFLISAELFKKMNEKTSLAVAYNNIAILNEEMKYHSKAIQYYKKAIELNLATENYTGLAGNYSNLGNSYRESDSLDLAFKSYKKGLKISEQINNQEKLASTYLNLGNFYKEQNNLKDAFTLYEKALAICKSEDIDFGKMIVYANMGQAYEQKGNYNKAIAYHDSSYNISNELNIPRIKAEILHSYVSLYQKMNRYDKAFHALQEAVTIEDTIFSSEQKTKFLELQEKNERLKIEKQLLKFENHSITNHLVFSYLVILFAISLIILSWFIYKRKIYKKEIELRNIELEKEIIKSKSYESELINRAIQIAAINENNRIVKENLQNISVAQPDVKNKELRKVIRNLDNSLVSNKAWEEFQFRFNEIHIDFYRNLINEYPDLSTTEIKILSLIKLNLSTKEIAEITNKSVRTIENQRNSIRKKMKLAPTENLGAKILSL